MDENLVTRAFTIRKIAVRVQKAISSPELQAKYRGIKVHGHGYEGGAEHKNEDIEPINLLEISHQ